jgi:hypothetical protein
LFRAVDWSSASATAGSIAQPVLSLQTTTVFEILARAVRRAWGVTTPTTAPVKATCGNQKIPTVANNRTTASRAKEIVT